MKIYSFNVNGIRSVCGKGFLDWMEREQPEIVCLQEIKANSDDLGNDIRNIDGYYSYFNSAKRNGYSGTAVYTKIKPISIETSIGEERFDSEGRLLRLGFDEFTLYNLYIPNGARDKRDMPYKLDIYERLIGAFESVKDEKVILAGDFNIAHKEVDVYNAKQNTNNTMFTPQEREQLDRIADLGYVDTFRKQNPDKASYSWWPYMANLRERDIGWRIDYIFATQSIYPRVKDSFIRKDVPGSDHCPVGIEIESEMKAENPVYAKDRLF